MADVIALPRGEVTRDAEETKHCSNTIVRSQRLAGRRVVGETKITEGLCDGAELNPRSDIRIRISSSLPAIPALINCWQDAATASTSLCSDWKTTLLLSP